MIPVKSLPLIGLLSGEFLSLLGNQIALVALPLLVLEYTQSPLATGIAGAGNLVPMLFTALAGGIIIDKLGAWRAGILADLLSGVSVAALAWLLVHVRDVSIWVIFGLVFLGAVFDPTGMAARQTMVPSLARLSGKPLLTVNGYRGALENGADMAGPILGGALVALVGAVYALYLNALSFCLCVALFAATVPYKPQRSAPLKPEGFSFWRGLRYVFQNDQLKPVALTGTAINMVVLPFLGLILPVLIISKFQSPLLLGMCLSAFVLAATVGALAVARVSAFLSRSAIFYGGVLIASLAIAGCAITVSPMELLVCAALAGSLLGAGNPLEQTILQECAPGRIAGQVFTAHHAVRYAAGAPGMILAGWGIEYGALEWVLVLGGGLLTLVAILGWRLAPLPPAR